METDVIIVGAGPAGLCAARSLSGCGLRIVVVEQQSVAAIGDPRYDGREIALTQKSVRILKHLGLWDRIEPEERSPLRDARVFDGASTAALEIGHELGRHPELGWLVSNHRIREAAWRAVQHAIAANADISIVAEETVKAVETDDAAARVTLASGQTLTGKLLIAADSRFSATRRMMGIGADLHDFGKSMLVCRMTHEKPHHHAAWEWFGYGQTLALLPTNPDPASGAHRSSVVVTLRGNEADELAHVDPARFDADIERRFDGRLGRMKLASTRHVYPLVAVYPRRFVGRRFAAIGDAAVGMHPVTAHGFNLGLLSVDKLSAEVVAAHTGGRDIGGASLLNRYESHHYRASRPLYLATRFITELYTRGSPPAKLMRRVILHAAGHFTPFRKAVAIALSDR